MSEDKFMKDNYRPTEVWNDQSISYRQVVGSLLWLVTGFDTASAVTCCAKKYTINLEMAHGNA